jgi:putative phosphonate metabolism protein
MSGESLEGYARYAVYYAPPAGSAMEAAGAAWLGWNPETGETPPPPDVPGPLLEARPELVRQARRYGFHGTLKAPFRIAEKFDPADLDAALQRFAAATPPAEGPALTAVHAEGEEMGFVALMPDGPSPEIDALAERCVTELDLLRAPLTAAEMAKRRRVGLDTMEDSNLRKWGYPYVLKRFKFHITLSVRVSRAEAAEIVPELDELFAPTLEWPFTIRELALFGDPGDGAPFRVLRRYPLTG